MPMSPRMTISLLRHHFSVPERALDRRLLAGLAAPILVLAVAVCAVVAFSKLSATRRSIEHTVDVIESLRNAQTSLLDAEVGRDGAVAAARVKAAVLRLRALSEGDPGQKARVDLLE